MHELLRSLAIHQARFHQKFLESWGPSPSPDQLDLVFESLVYDGMWLTKFPLAWTPTYGVHDLDRLQKGWAGSPRDSSAVADAVRGIRDLRPRVDADTLRFVLKLTPADLGGRVELFFGARAMNKPLWQYLLAWFEHGAALRGRLTGPTLLETAFW